MTFLETDRLLLRKVAAADYPYFREYLMDKEVDRMMLRSPCDTEEDVRLGFDWFLHKEERAYVIIHKETGRVIGNLTVYNHVPPEVAEQETVRGKRGKSLYFAMSPAFRRRGFMLEAVSAVMKRLFYGENAEYIHCGCLSCNLPSKALQERLGFAPLFTQRFSFEGQEMESVENILWKE